MYESHRQRRVTEKLHYHALLPHGHLVGQHAHALPTFQRLQHRADSPRAGHLHTTARAFSKCPNEIIEGYIAAWLIQCGDTTMSRNVEIGDLPVSKMRREDNDTSSARDRGADELAPLHGNDALQDVLDFRTPHCSGFQRERTRLLETTPAKALALIVT